MKRNSLRPRSQRCRSARDSPCASSGNDCKSILNQKNKLQPVACTTQPTESRGPLRPCSAVFGPSRVEVHGGRRMLARGTRRRESHKRPPTLTEGFGALECGSHQFDHQFRTMSSIVASTTFGEAHCRSIARDSCSILSSTPSPVFSTNARSIMASQFGYS